MCVQPSNLSPRQHSSQRLSTQRLNSPSTAAPALRSRPRRAAGISLPRAAHALPHTEGLTEPKRRRGRTPMCPLHTEIAQHASRWSHAVPSLGSRRACARGPRLATNVPQHVAAQRPHKQTKHPIHTRRPLAAAAAPARRPSAHCRRRNRWPHPGGAHRIRAPSSTRLGTAPPPPRRPPPRPWPC